MPRACSFALITALLAAPTPALAEAPAADARRAEAKAMATRGDTEFYAGRCEQAVALWQRAEATFHAPTILLRIARCQVALGQLVAAAALLERVAGEVPRSDAPPAFFAAREDARRDLAAVRPRLASLTVAVRAGRAVVIEIDGQKQPQGAAALPVDPGDRVVRVRAGGSSWQTTVKLKEGEHRRCDVALWAEVDPDRSMKQRVVGLAALATGTAALGIGVGLAAARGDDRDGRSGSVAPEVAVGIGTALVVGGALTLITAPRIEGDGWRVSIAAGPGAVTAGLTF